MNGIVIDASVTLSWCFPDEQTKMSMNVLDRLKSGEQALVTTVGYHGLMLITKESQDHAYSQAAQAYWDELYAAVQKDVEAYNARQPILARIGVEWVDGDGELVGQRNARQFTAYHIQSRQSATAINRNAEKPPHTVDIICYVAVDGPHHLVLKPTADGKIEAHDDIHGQMVLADVVY